LIPIFLALMEAISFVAGVQPQRFSVQQEIAPKKSYGSKKINVIVKGEREFLAVIFSRLGQNVAPSLRLKGC